MKYKYLIFSGLLFLVQLVSADGIIESGDSTDVMIGSTLSLLSIGLVITAIAVIIYIIIQAKGGE